MNKRFCATLCMVAFVGSVGASVIHAPAEALASGLNPMTNSTGAVWTFSKRVHANPPLSQGSLLNYQIGGSAMGGLVGFAQTWGGGYDCPFVCVNATDNDCAVENCGTVHPGEILMHPTGTCYGQTERRVAMTFTAPRNGYYSLQARFRANTNGGGGVETSVFLNGGVLLQEELKRVENGDLVQGTPVSYPRLFMKKGDQLAFVVGPDEPGDWGHGNDVTVLSLDLAEIESFADEDVVDTADLGQAILAQTDAELHGQDTFADPSGLGTWTFRCTVPTGDYTFDDAWWNVPISCYSDSDTMGSRGVVFKYRGENTEPTILACGFEGTAGSCGWFGGSWPESVHNNERGCYLPFDMVSPGEVCVFPGNQWGECSSTWMRFTVAKTGTYILTLNARDLCKSIDAVNPGDGVDVAVFVSGSKVFEQRVSFEVEPHVAFYQMPARSLRQGERVDIRVFSRQDSNGAYNNSYDGTGMFVGFTRLSGSVPTGRFEADIALRDGRAKALESGNPGAANAFMSQGASWTVGSASVPGRSGNFVPLTSWMSSKDATWNNCSTDFFEGWVGSDGLPAVMANTTSATTSFDGTDVSPNEFLMCPHSWGVYGVMRFVAPTDGVYSVDAVCRDIDPWMQGWISPDNYGVMCHVMANDGYAASDHACNDTRVAQAYAWSAPYLQNAVLRAERLYLKEGEVIDLCVGARGGREEDRDSTAVMETISVDEPREVVSVNLIPAGNSNYRGRGRVGYGERWGVLTLHAGETGAQLGGFMRNDDNLCTAVQLSVAPAAEGQTVAVKEGAGTPVASGLLSSGSEAPYGWKVSGLTPNASYRLYLYGTGAASFACGGMTAVLSGQWFNALAKEFAVLDAAADANGEIEGTFVGDDAEAVFCALQIEGDEFVPHRGVVLSIR